MLVEDCPQSGNPKVVIIGLQLIHTAVVNDLLTIKEAINYSF